MIGLGGGRKGPGGDLGRAVGSGTVSVGSSVGSRRVAVSSRVTVGDERLRPVEGLPTVLAGMESGAERPQRDEAFGGEQEGEESGAEIHRPGDEADADDHGDQRHGDRGDEFEGETREEGDAQRGQARRMVVRAQPAQGPGVLAGAPEADEDGQALGEFGEMVREPLEGAHALLRRLLGVAADEDHEQRHEREAGDDDDRGEDVGEDDAHEQDHGHDRGLREGGDDGGEVVVEVVDAAGHGDRGLRPRLAGPAHEGAEDPGAQAPLRLSGLRGAQTLIGPQARPSQAGAEDAEDDPERDVTEVEDGAHERLGDEDDADRPGTGGGDCEKERPPAPGQGQEDRQRRAHERIATGTRWASGMCDSVSLPRNWR